MAKETKFPCTGNIILVTMYMKACPCLTQTLEKLLTITRGGKRR